MASTRHFEVNLKRSPAGHKETHRRTVAGLGLSRMGQKVFLADTPAVRGMLYKVVHLLEVTPKDGPPPPSTRQRARAARKARAS